MDNAELLQQGRAAGRQGAKAGRALGISKHQGIQGDCEEFILAQHVSDGYPNPACLSLLNLPSRQRSKRGAERVLEALAVVFIAPCPGSSQHHSELISFSSSHLETLHNISLSSSNEGTPWWCRQVGIKIEWCGLD